MKTIISSILLLCVVSFFSCSKDDSQQPTEATNETYLLASIEPNRDLDPSASGAFNDRELFNDIDCTSSITLNSDDTFIWDRFQFNQPSISTLGAVISYEPIVCNVSSPLSGEFEIIDGEIIFDPFLLAQILENKLEIIIQAELVVRRDGINRKERVDLLLTYIKESV